MKTLIVSRLRSLFLLTMLLGALAPMGSKAQILTMQDKIDAFLWNYEGAEVAPHLFPDLDEDLIGAEGTAFLDSLEYIGPIAEFAEDNLKEGSKVARFSKGVGKFVDVIG